MSCWLHKRGFVRLSDSNVNSQETSWQLSWMIPKWLALSHMAELSGYMPRWVWSFSRLAIALFSSQSQLNIWWHDLTKRIFRHSDEEGTLFHWWLSVTPVVFQIYKCVARGAKLTCLCGHSGRTGPVLSFRDSFCVLTLNHQLWDLSKMLFDLCKNPALL